MGRGSGHHPPGTLPGQLTSRLRSRKCRQGGAGGGGRGGPGEASRAGVAGGRLGRRAGADRAEQTRAARGGRFYNLQFPFYNRRTVCRMFHLLRRGALLFSMVCAAVAWHVVCKV